MSKLRAYLDEREADLKAELEPMREEQRLLQAELAGVRVARHAIDNPPKQRGRPPLNRTGQGVPASQEQVREKD